MKRKKGGLTTWLLMAAILVLLLSMLLALWQLDLSQVYWVNVGQEEKDVTGGVEEKPLALLLDWRIVPGTPLDVAIPRIAQCALQLAPNTDYSLIIRTTRPLISVQVNEQEMYRETTQPMPLVGYDFRVHTDETGNFALLLRLDDEPEMQAPLVLLGIRDMVNAEDTLRVVIFTALATIILTGGIVMLINYLMQGRENTTLAIWLLYMLLLLAQVDLLFPQSTVAELLREATMLLFCACLCCYASLCLGKRSDAPVLLGIAFVGILLALTWLGGYAFTGQRIALELSMPMQGIFLLMTGYFTITGLVRSRAWTDGTTLAYAMVILMLMEGVIADMYLTRSHMMLVSPMMTFGGLMTGVHMWLLAQLQAKSRKKSEMLETELERRVIDRTEQLRLANKQLSRIDALRGEFFSHIAHDLQSPLTIIRGSLDLVLDDTPVTEDERENYLRMARASAEKMTNRIKALRGLAVLEETAFVPARQPIRPVIAQALSNFQAMYRNTNIRFSMEGPDVEATFDVAWLQNALDRLVSNAVRYTPEGGSIILGWELATFGVNVYVMDSGCGIAAADLPNLFQRFYKGWNSRDGFGIGLAVVQRVAQRHGGRVWVESETGVGSTFYIYFPDLPAEIWEPNAEEKHG